MVIVRLIGGLGNQLFQYATARRIAHTNGVPLKIDITPFSEYKLHKYSLGSFNIAASFATPAEIAKAKGVWHRLLSRFQPYYLRSIVKEQFFHFDSNILKVSGNAYLDGYWQTEKYFQDIEALIRNELAIKIKPDSENIRIAEGIATS